MSTEKYVFKFSDEVARHVEEELNETEVIRRAAFAELKKWLNENPEIRARSTEPELLPFLRCCKFNIEKTKTKITNFYKMKSEVGHWYRDRDPASETVQQLVRSGNIVPLRQTVDDKMVIIYKTAGFDPKQVDINEVIKTSIMIFEMLYKEYELAQIYGIILLIDMNGTTFEHFRQWSSISFLKNCVSASKNFYSRPQLLVFFNVPRFVTMVMNLFKSFLPAKIKSRLQVYYQGSEVLSELIDPDILPLEYEGNGDSVLDLGEEWAKLLLDNRKWFLEDEHHVS